jgi:hypothetical protein
MRFRQATTRSKPLASTHPRLEIEVDCELEWMKGATTFGITTFSITAFSITAFSIMTLSIMTLSIMTLSILTFGIMIIKSITQYTQHAGKALLY